MNQEWRKVGLDDSVFSEGEVLMIQESVKVGLYESGVDEGGVR